jgi:hypothetical protein
LNIHIKRGQSIRNCCNRRIDLNYIDKISSPLASPTGVKSALLNAASLPTTSCDGKSHGYFSGDVDNFKEPLLYINNMK